MRVVVHAIESYESEVEQPLGEDRQRHRMWTWPDGSWVLLRWLDDGYPTIVTSHELVAELHERGGTYHLSVERMGRRSILTTSAL